MLPTGSLISESDHCVTPPALNPAEAEMSTDECSTKGANLSIDLIDIDRIDLDLESYPNVSPLFLLLRMATHSYFVFGVGVSRQQSNQLLSNPQL